MKLQAIIVIKFKVRVMKNFTLFVLCMILINPVFSQGKDEKIKTGWTMGLIPTVSYNSDLGLQYGGLVQLFDFKDGSAYPKYHKMFRVEISRYTKGSGTNQFFFDSENLFKKKKIRFTTDLSYLTEKALDFYGFNGNEVFYNPDFMTDNSNDYISRMFYRMERKMIRFTGDFQGTIIPGKLKWLAGVAFFNYQMATVDIAKLNKGKDIDKQLPDTALLFDKYVEWKLIPENEIDGGHQQMIKTGIIYDTRDIEANPSKGLWTELLFVTAPSFLGNNENAFTKMVFIHRQYFSIIPKQLTFVYRLGYQGTIFGKAPFYSQSYMFSSFSSVTIVEGLGGAKSIRGVVRNRLVGDGIAWSNFEFRWKFLRKTIGNQNIYLALNPFLDAGKVVKTIEIDQSKVDSNAVLANYFSGNTEKLHFTVGCGLHIGLNENFVISADFGRALSALDGKNGIYIGTNWLF